MIDPSRRSLIIGIGASLIAAPAIVRASSLLKVKPSDNRLIQCTERFLPTQFWSNAQIKMEGQASVFDPHAWHPAKVDGFDLVERGGMVLMQRIPQTHAIGREYKWQKI